METNEKYYFFWNGFLSQWHRSDFTIDGVTFNCCEQYMMNSKAKLFNDISSMMRILEEPHPRKQKALGKKVLNFDQKIWDEHKEKIVYDGNWAKFTQNKKLREMLLETGDKILVEASPYDTIWGIGISQDDPDRFFEEKWKGQNLLGKCLTKVREDIRKSIF